MQTSHKAVRSDKLNILVASLVCPILLGEARLLGTWLHIWLTEVVVGDLLRPLGFDMMQHTLLIPLGPLPCFQDHAVQPTHEHRLSIDTHLLAAYLCNHGPD